MPVVVLAFGNTALKFFKNQDGGITSLSATTEWNQKWEAWICWSIHPASVLYAPENKRSFAKALDNFQQCLASVGYPVEQKSKLKRRKRR